MGPTPRHPPSFLPESDQPTQGARDLGGRGDSEEPQGVVLNGGGRGELDARARGLLSCSCGRGSQAWADAPGPEAGKEKPSSPPVSVTDHRFPADQPQRKAAGHRTPARGSPLLLPAEQIGAEQKGKRGSRGLGPLWSAPRTADRPTA